MGTQGSVKYLLTKFFLLSAFLNAVLKSGPESDITLFRIFLPFVFVYFFKSHKIEFKSFTVVVGIFLFFQVISLYLSQYALSFAQVVFAGHYLTMIFMFYFVMSYVRNDPDDLYRFLKLFYVLLVAFMLFQYVTDVRLPNTNERGLNAWYWNQNDASLAVVGFVILALRVGDVRGLFVVHALALFLVSVNDSRAALWGVLAYAGVWFLSSIGRRGYRSSSMNRLIISCGTFIALTILLILFSGNVAKAVDQLLYGVYILSGYAGDNLVTSVGVRSFAAVYAIEDLLNSYGLGTGSGNSVTMLAINNYAETSLVTSIHNMPLQILLELGLPLSAFLLLGLKKHSPLHMVDFLGILVVFSFVSLSQSGGFLVNYFPMVCFYFCLLVPVENLYFRRKKCRVVLFPDFRRKRKFQADS